MSFRAKGVIQQLMTKQKREKLIPRSSFDYSMLIADHFPMQREQLPQNLIYSFLNKIHRHMNAAKKMRDKSEEEEVGGEEERGKDREEEEQRRREEVDRRVREGGNGEADQAEGSAKHRRQHFGMESRYLTLIRQIEYHCEELAQK